MSSLPISKSVLLRTSAATSVLSTGGIIKVEGLFDVNSKNVTSINQLKYRAEVAQVATIGSNSYTPVNSTLYQVAVFDPNRTVNGYNETIKLYSYTTPADVTTLGNAAAQREAIHVAIIAKINADPSNHAIAATLAGGTGFTVTDDGGYYPVHAQSMTNVLFVNQVLTTSGFTADPTITTAGVSSLGVGANLLAAAPVADWMNGGNLISGVPDAPKTVTGLPAVSGQNYDAFVIQSLALASNETMSGSQLALINQIQTIWVDNGTGSSTANLAGFKAFERTMLSLVFDQFASDPATIVTMGNTAAVSQGLGTGLPSGVAQAENVVSFGNGFSAHYSPIATSTLLALVSTNDGLGLVLDATAAEGVELSAPTWANSQKSFVVGKTAFSVYAKITIDDVSGLNPLWVGFRKKAAYGATFTAYSDYAVIGIGGAAGQIYTNTEKNGAGNTATDTTQTWADATTRVLEVRVDKDGACTFFIDGYKPTVTQAFTLDADDEMIPCIYALQSADLGTPSLLEFAAVATDSWRQ